MQSSEDYSRVGEPLRRLEKVQVAAQEIGCRQAVIRWVEIEFF
jgi:hypothetical protein